MKKLIITGCNGQLGRAVNELLKDNAEYECVNTDVAELDITDMDAVNALFEEVKPYAVINCAAYTAVDKCETDKDNAYRINAIGPRNLSIAATKYDAKMVHVSTDYVFPGDGTVPYTEFDTTGPQSAYGATKLAGEHFVQQFATKYFIIRTAWLYGDGNNFARTMLRLSETHDKVRVVNDQFGTPTSAKELAKAILYLLPTENYGLFHGTCEGSCSWADFAAEVFRLAGLPTKVEGISTEEYGSPTKRPAYSILENKMFKLTTDFMFADWKDAIAEYMKDYQK
ncbi:MAG: dTDP-4-dehydrorhamnose reductase [Lachnospiraceae bacterium]|nr:dTDP-4-dehydrorhamnose reductase [Lachnospiraceae bacterium]MBR3683464.1 dTDP-4-dehydrorhamnose reductase [Lachnospiraceae bacterium]